MGIKVVMFSVYGLAFFFYITIEYILVRFSDFYSELRTDETCLSECFGKFSVWLPFLHENKWD